MVSQHLDTRHFRPRQGLAAFMLIELLVVVAIIALLVSIVLPALSRARMQAKTVLCMSNARQIALALHSYAQDYGGQLPVYVNTVLYRAPIRPGFDGYWTDKLISGPDPWNGGYLPEPKDKYWKGYGGYSDGVWLCPEISKDWVYAGGGGYGVNLLHVMEDFHYGFPPPTNTRLFRVKRPSDIWLVGDGQPSTVQFGPGSRDYGTGQGHLSCPVYADLRDIWLTSMTAGGQAGGRHNGGAGTGFHSDVNISFIDAHAETWQWEDCSNNERNLFAHDYNNWPWDGVYE